MTFDHAPAAWASDGIVRCDSRLFSCGIEKVTAVCLVAGMLALTIQAVRASLVRKNAEDTSGMWPTIVFMCAAGLVNGLTWFLVMFHVIS